MRALVGERYLIWRFKHGSAEAFERIYERHKNDLLKLAVVLLGETHAAEDIVHDVFVHVACTRANLRVTGNLKSLLATSVANRARNIVRASRQRRSGGGARPFCCAGGLGAGKMRDGRFFLVMLGRAGPLYK